jgi:hypothetical protein
MFQSRANAILQLRLINDFVSSKSLGNDALAMSLRRNTSVMARDSPAMSDRWGYFSTRTR